jgi:hypothetical protein
MATPTTLPATFVAGDVLTAAQMNNLRGAFRVLQVVSSTFSTQNLTSSTSYADTGLTATITPSSTTSKILCLVNQAGCGKTAGNASSGISLQLLRGASSINIFCIDGGNTNSSLGNVVGTQSTGYLDSPATTSATTYKTQFKNSVAAASVFCQVGDSVSTITLLEISA